MQDAAREPGQGPIEKDDDEDAAPEDEQLGSGQIRVEPGRPLIERLGSPPDIVRSLLNNAVPQRRTEDARLALEQVVVELGTLADAKIMIVLLRLDRQQLCSFEQFAVAVKQGLRIGPVLGDFGAFRGRFGIGLRTKLIEPRLQGFETRRHAIHDRLAFRDDRPDLLAHLVERRLIRLAVLERLFHVAKLGAQLIDLRGNRLLRRADRRLALRGDRLRAGLRHGKTEENQAKGGGERAGSFHHQAVGLGGMRVS